MKTMNSPADIPFRQLLDALLDVDTPFQARYLYRLSDLDQIELVQFREIWSQVADRRRQALMEDLNLLNETDFLLSFEAIGRFALEDIDPNVRAAAVQLLDEYEEPDLALLFLDMMETDNSALVRAAAAQGLGRYVYLGEIDELPAEMLRDLEDRLIRVVNGNDAPPVRRRALESLGFSSRPEVVPLIETAYTSSEREWLGAALFAMGRSANEQWEERVLAMFDSPHPIVRTEAARAAGELELKEALDGLMEMLDDDNDEVRTAVIWSLSQIGGEGVRDALEELQEETVDEGEAEFIESALDNLAFTEDMELFTLFDMPGPALPDEDEEEAELYELIDDEDLEDDEDAID